MKYYSEKKGCLQPFLIHTWYENNPMVLVRRSIGLFPGYFCIGFGCNYEKVFVMKCNKLFFYTTTSSRFEQFYSFELFFYVKYFKWDLKYPMVKV